MRDARPPHDGRPADGRARRWPDGDPRSWRARRPEDDYTSRAPLVRRPLRHHLPRAACDAAGGRCRAGTGPPAEEGDNSGRRAWESKESPGAAPSKFGWSAWCNGRARRSMSASPRKHVLVRLGVRLRPSGCGGRTGSGVPEAGGLAGGSGGVPAGARGAEPSRAGGPARRS